MAVKGDVVVQAIGALCPQRFAVERDVTGLQVGRTDREVERVLCTMDLTLAVAEEAVRRGAGLVVSHHAVVFRPLKNLRTDTFKGRILETLIKGDVAVYVPHTAMDVVEGGMNDHLAASVGLLDPRFLEQTGSDASLLLVAAAPGDAGDAADGGADAGPAGGNALRATLLGRGALRVDLRAGRLEVLAPERRAAGLTRALEKAGCASPRAFPLRSDDAPRGIGRVGKLAAPTPLLDLAAALKQELNLPGVRVVAREGDATVRKAAVLGGDGRSYVDKAIFAGADVLVTGDVDHHTALMARARGLSLIDLGHWGSEVQVIDLLVQGLRRELAGQDVEVVASEVDTNPFAFV
jgi:dinuclear metal center YbgI/SA1388 family protein